MTVGNLWVVLFALVIGLQFLNPGQALLACLGVLLFALILIVTLTVGSQHDGRG